MADIIKYEDLYKYIIPEVPGCPKALILQHIERVAREYCEKTGAWRETLDIDQVQSERTYSLILKYDAEVKHIVGVWLKTEQDVTNDYEGLKIDPKYYELIREPIDKLKFSEYMIPSANVTDGISVEVVVKPKPAAKSISQRFFSSWHEAILSGTLRNLHSLPASTHPWVSRTTYALNERTYNQEVTKAMNWVAKEGRARSGGLQG